MEAATETVEAATVDAGTMAAAAITAEAATETAAVRNATDGMSEEASAGEETGAAVAHLEQIAALRGQLEAAQACAAEEVAQLQAKLDASAVSAAEAAAAVERAHGEALERAHEEVRCAQVAAAEAAVRASASDTARQHVCERNGSALTSMRVSATSVRTELDALRALVAHECHRQQAEESALILEITAQVAEAARVTMTTATASATEQLTTALATASDARREAEASERARRLADERLTDAEARCAIAEAQASAHATETDEARTSYAAASEALEAIKGKSKEFIKSLSDEKRVLEAELERARRAYVDADSVCPAPLIRRQRGGTRAVTRSSNAAYLAPTIGTHAPFSFIASRGRALPHPIQWRPRCYAPSHAHAQPSRSKPPPPHLTRSRYLRLACFHVVAGCRTGQSGQRRRQRSRRPSRRPRPRLWSVMRSWQPPGRPKPSFNQWPPPQKQRRWKRWPRLRD